MKVITSENVALEYNSQIFLFHQKVMMRSQDFQVFILLDYMLLDYFIPLRTYEC